jgi:hypothetical protein
MIGENLVKIHVIESKTVSLFSVPEAKKKRGIKKGVKIEAKLH